MSILFVLLLVLLYCIYPFLRLLYRQSRSPLRFIHGPPLPAKPFPRFTLSRQYLNALIGYIASQAMSFFMGNLAEMHDQENNNLISNWEAMYGTTFVYRGFVGGCRLMTTDPVAVGYILRRAYDYPKPDFVRDSLAQMAGVVKGHDGLLTAEGQTHRRQRAILQPAFTTRHIKSLAPVFWDSAEALSRVLGSVSDAGRLEAAETGRDELEIDVMVWLARATLDVIGTAGFGYQFNSLKSAVEGTQEDPLSACFGVIFSTARKFRVLTILQVWFPFLRRFRRNSGAMIQARDTMKGIAVRLIEKRKTEFLAEKAATTETEKATEQEVDETNLGRDILSVLVRSSLTNQNEEMPTNELVSQISTFIAAGHETTASALTWALYALVRETEVQQRLRDEIRQAEIDADVRESARLDTDILSKLPYLDAVVKEVLRVHAPVTNTMRVCLKDEDWVPTSAAVNASVDSDVPLHLAASGQGHIHLKKHDIISIPIQAINKSPAIWGEDARIFRPERHLVEIEPSAQGRLPALYANTLTFLNGNGNNIDGNRACIGWRFSLLEIKIFLYVLIRDLEFTIDPAIVIEKKLNVVTRPIVKSEPEKGNQMPLRIRRTSPLPVRDATSMRETTPARETIPMRETTPTRSLSPPPISPISKRPIARDRVVF
ncbi:cytochrome P450 [Mycena floridula]|nr:cytochrome P450 [Mycena floridula]